MSNVRDLRQIVSPKQTILQERTCETCGEARHLMQVGVAPYAFRREMKCRCDREADENREIADMAKAVQDRHDSILKASFIPSKYQDANFDNPPPSVPLGMKHEVFPALQEILDGFPDLSESRMGHEIVRYKLQGHAIVLYGDYGTGKTYSMAAMLLAARKKCLAGYLLNVTSFMRELRASYNGDALETENRVLGRYETTPILVIDDLDKFQATEWSTSILYSLLNNRSTEGRPTFITSNHDAAQLMNDTFSQTPNKGRAILERIIENQWFEVRGKSVRRRIPSRASLHVIRKAE